MAGPKDTSNHEPDGREAVPTADYGGAALGPGAQIGPYKLISILGEGGYGIVYLADQQRPVKRRVALKIIKPGMDSKQVIARFEAERQALALLDHPNIAHVFNAGTTDAGRPYFAMEYVKGVPITEHCDRHKLTIEERLKLFLAVCEAVQHAHQKAIIHRDIKPSNILVAFEAEQAIPMIIDFGVAKALTQPLTERTLVTEQAQMIGTPEYMSPEQAEMTSQDIDTRTDIYSLGVLLYELLTGTLPFDPQALRESGPEQMRRTIREQDPQTPSARFRAFEDEQSLGLAQDRGTDIRTLRHLLHGELDWITLKAMAKDRTRRYQTAHAFAEDMQRFLDEEPVLAGPPSSTYRLQKFIKRNRGLFVSIATTSLFVLSAAVVSIVLAITAARAKRAETEQRQRAEQAQSAAETERDRAEAQELISRQRAYAAEINVAFQALEENNLNRALELLDRQRPAPGEEDLRGFEWRHLWRCCQSDDLASFEGGYNTSAAFSRDGRYLALAGGKSISIRDVVSRAVVTELPTGALTVAFSPAADILVSAGEPVRLWNTNTWDVIEYLPESRPPTVFSSDGRWLVTGTEGGYRIWNAETWEEKGSCSIEFKGGLPSWHMRNAVALSSDGNLLVTPGHHNDPNVRGFQVWQFPTLEALNHFQPDDGMFTAAFLPDGKYLLTGHYLGNICVWDIDEGRIVETRKEHTAGITALVPAPDGMTFFTSSYDSSLIIWDAATLQPLTRLRGHLGEIWALALSPDGRLLASSARDDSTRLWDATMRHTPLEFQGASVFLGFSGDNESLVAANECGALLWNITTGDSTEIAIPGLRGQLDPAGESWRFLAVHGSRMLWLMSTPDGAVELWDLLNSSRVATWPAFDRRATAVAFSTDGLLVAAGSRTGTVKIWDVKTQGEVSEFSAGNIRLWCLAFSPDDRYLAISGESCVWIWDAERESLALQLVWAGSRAECVAFSPDGRVLASTDLSDHAVRLWEVPSGKSLGVLRGHAASVWGVAFAPDGKTLATFSDPRVKLWNLATKQEVATFQNEGSILSMEFSTDGNTLAIGRADSRAEMDESIRLWQVPSFEEIGASSNPM
jgi:WD40 repeat protein/serine/threonine protein kinase